MKLLWRSNMDPQLTASRNKRNFSRCTIVQVQDTLLLRHTCLVPFSQYIQQSWCVATTVRRFAYMRWLPTFECINRWTRLYSRWVQCRVGRWPSHNGNVPPPTQWRKRLVLLAEQEDGSFRQETKIATSLVYQVCIIVNYVDQMRALRTIRRFIGSWHTLVLWVWLTA